METRKPYQKPKIKEVKLLPEEAVLQNCKGPTGTNRQAGRCQEVSNCQNKVVGS